MRRLFCSPGLAPAFLAAAVALGCVGLTPAEEARLGAEIHAQIHYGGLLLEDRVVSRYLSELGGRVAAAIDGDAARYRFYVVVDDDINAFAAPGGNVYVHTGTLLRTRNAAELAGVLAHEMGHLALDHVSENVARRRALGAARNVGVLAGAVAAGPAGASAASMLGGLAGVAALNSFGREAEDEADAFAVELLPRTGYDPEGLVTFFHTLLREGGEAPAALLSSHPATEARIAEARRRVDALPARSDLRMEDGGRLEIIQRRIRLLTGTASPTP